MNKNMLKHNENLSKYACFDKEALRFYKIDEDIRTDFFRDVDKIIYSLSYTRYIDKTQVFSFKDNDHISKRITHVQMVSRIARTIGRALSLNEDLIEAASLGHDLGHVPFGHLGERILNDISLDNNEGYFNHNIQSVRLLMELEHSGKGSNLCLQTLDAIMCHNGEIELPIYEPIAKTKEDFLREYHDSYKSKEVVTKLRPMTLEGCVVRISDIISYVGRDIEDACMLKLFDKRKIPKEITDVLGFTNSSIIDTIINDIIKNSTGKPYIKMSDDVFKALKSLKKFNYENIYDKANSKDNIERIELMFKQLFNKLKEDVINKTDSNINNAFLSKMPDTYILNTTPARKVIDYIAGMTDDYFIREYNLYIKNK